MNAIKVGIWGFGKTGRLVANEFLNDARFTLAWVVRKSTADHHKYASRLLGYEYDAGEIIAADEVSNTFFHDNPVDVLIDFSNSSGVQAYQHAADAGIPIVSAISQYEEGDLALLESLAAKTAVLHSPNITLGINVLLIAAQILQKIAPHADIEVVEEHFKTKPEISGTAKKIAHLLQLEDEHVNSIRVGGVVGRHEIIFGMPNQTIRLSHESISRAAFGQGAIFAANYLLQQTPGRYSMEGIIADMFRDNVPVY